MKKFIFLLYFLLYFTPSTLAQDFTDFVHCYFCEKNGEGKVRLNVKLQNGNIVTLKAEEWYILPYDRNNTHTIELLMADASFGSHTSWYGENKTFNPNDDGKITIIQSQQQSHKQYTYYFSYTHLPIDFNITINQIKSTRISGTFCENDDLPSVGYYGRQFLVTPPKLQILNPINETWNDLVVGYYGNRVPFNELSSLLGESLFYNQFKLRIEYAGYHSNVINMPIYYPNVIFTGNLSLIDSTISINNIPNNQNITISHAIKNTNYDIVKSSSITKPLFCGLNTILIEASNACPVIYYANIMKATHNYIQNDVDFWSKSNTTRNDAIILHSYRKLGGTSHLSPQISPNYSKGKVVHSDIYVLDENNAQGTETVSDVYYYVQGSLGANEIKITYPNHLDYIPQTIKITLDKCFENITASATQIDPECSDGFGTLELSEIQGGLNNGYYYTLNRDNTIIEENTISGKSVSINVQNGDRVKIYDNKKKENELFPYTEERAWPDKNGYVVSGLSAIQPSFSYPRANIKCFGGTTEQVVEISNYSKNINYSWTVKINKSSENTTSGIANGSTIVINNLPADEHSITWHITKNNDTCWDDDSTSFTITQPTEDISFNFSTNPTTCKNSNDGEIIISNLKGGNGGDYSFKVNEESVDLQTKDGKNGSIEYILTNNFYSSNKEDGEQTDYVVTVKDRKGCSKSSDNISIDYENPQQTLQLIPTATSCDAAKNGILSYDTIGRFKPTKVDYISTLETSPTINDELKLINYQFGVGTYNIGLIDGKGCRFDSSFTIVSNTYTFSSSTENASCADAPNGRATIAVKPDKSGVFEPSEYILELIKPKSDNTKDKIQIQSKERIVTADNLHYGTYKLTVNHDDKCTYENTVNIDTNHYAWDIKSIDLSCLAAANGNISASINKKSEDDNGLFDINSFTWKLNGETIENGTNPAKKEDKTYPEFKRQAHTPGIYTLSIAHDNHCIHENSVEVKVNDYQWTTNHLNLSCKEVSNGYISATINRKDDFNGVFKINKYSWTVNDKPYKSGNNPANEKDGTYSFELTDLAPGLYQLSLTHDDKCTESTTVKIDVNQYSHFVNTTNAPCAEINSGSAIAVSKILSGTPESFHPHYIWTIKNGEPVPTGSDNFITERYSGNYNVRLEWEGGCYTKINFDIKHDTLRPSFLTTHAECADKQSIGGKVEINMSPERTYRYIWDDDTEGTEYNIAENLAAGSHTVKIFDQHNCSIKESFDILNSDFSVNVKSENALCRQDATGKVTFDIKGGRGKYAIDWQGNSALSQKDITANTFTQDKVPVGVYTINVKDETNCVSTHKVTIASGNLKVSHKETEASCSSIGNARAEIAVSGAKLPVTYKWSDNVETPDPVRNNLTNGNYVVTVVDQNNCSMPVDIKIYSKELSTATAIDSATCGLDPDGAAEIRLFSATSPFTFSWPDGKITSESKRSGLDKGNYDVLITDANGCEVHANVDIPHKGYLQNDVPSSINLCYNGEITVDANEFDGYEWIRNGWVVDNNRFLTVKSPGTYIVKANAFDDCYAIDTISVTMSPTSFSPYFRMSSASYINDTLVVMEMSQTNPDKYSWKYDTLAFDCDNSKGSERELRLIPKLSGIYSVTLSAENQDCVSDISKPVEIFATTRPDNEFSPLYVEHSIVKDFIISPNPTKGPITVEVNLSQISDVRLTIYDLNFGKIRKQVTLRNSDNYKLDINDVISTGAYVVILQTGNETKQIKYIVSR